MTTLLNSPEWILKEALEWAKHNRPNSSLQNKAAFANSVSYFITGFSGGFGGPSIREHLCSWSLGTVTSVSIEGETMMAIVPSDLPMPGNWELNDAIVHCDQICFGPIDQYRNQMIQIMEREPCFDNDPSDLEALRGKYA